MIIKTMYTVLILWQIVMQRVYGMQYYVRILELTIITYDQIQKVLVRIIRDVMSYEDKEAEHG